MGYKLADGSDSEQYKIGDEFEVVSHEHFVIKKGEILSLCGDIHKPYPMFEPADGEEVNIHFRDNMSVCVHWGRLKPHRKPFTKSDLKDGMRIQYRNGKERIIFDSASWVVEKDPSRGYSSGVMEQVGHVDWLSEDLTHREGMSVYDIIKVTDRDDTVVFEREPEKKKITLELTDEQIESLKQQGIFKEN